MKRSIFFLSILFVASLVMTICIPAWADDVIKIGVIGPMNFVQGKGHWNGAVLAAEKINAKGGIQLDKKKMKIKVIKADSNEFISMTDATNAMERLMTQDKVTLINLGTVGGMLKKELGIEKPRVAIVAEKAMWIDPMIEAIKANVPNMGMELVGIWRPSDKATSVTAELTALQRKDAQIIFTIFSASVGITFSRQAGELKIPAAFVGINVEAQKDGFWAATEGKGNYAVSITTFVRGVSYNEFTQPFIEKYIKRFGELPTYTAVTHDAIKDVLVKAIEEAGAIDAEKLIPILEKGEFKGAGAPKTKFDKSHDLVFGPGYATGITFQWQDGKMKGWWPNGWEGVTYEGMVPYKIPPWMIEKYKK